MPAEYDFRNCQSLFGYGQEVHQRSSGICKLCGAGNGPKVSFDFWRQLSVDHLIGGKQGGHSKEIKVAIAKKFKNFPKKKIDEFAWKIDLKNMVTACHFCNSATSRYLHNITMCEVIEKSSNSLDSVLKAVGQEAKRALARKRKIMKWKMDSLQEAFEVKILPGLRTGRRR